MSKKRPKPAAALYFSGALSATPIGDYMRNLRSSTELLNNYKILQEILKRYKLNNSQQKKDDILSHDSKE